MASGRIGLGVIGINPHNMGSTLALLAGVPDLRYELRGMCARSETVLANHARQLGCPFWTTDAHALCQRPDLDVIAVFSPDHLHAQHCTWALEAGKHVVCTKPMTTSLDDARRLVRLVRQTGRKFLVGQTMRFDRQFLAIQQLVKDGDLGELIVGEAHYVHDIRPVFALTPWRLEAPQDFMYGGVTHPIDILQSFLGPVEEVHCYANKGHLSTYPLRANFVLNLKFAGGRIGRVLGLYEVVHPPLPMMQVGLYGTRGSAVGEFTDNEPGQLRVVLDRIGPSPLVSDFPPERDASAYGHGQTMIRYMRHFQECLDQDRDPVPGVLDGARAVAVAAAAWESADTGRPVRVVLDLGGN
jgi:predicted dehydrogenase